MTTTKPAPSETRPASPVRTKPPVLLTAVGRQRTGKTVFLNALTQTVIRQGGDVEVWNTDHLNVSHSISHFHPDARKPEASTLKDQKVWLEQQIEGLVTRKKDVVLDIGGGWTAFHEIINTTPLVPQLARLGIKVVVVYMLGTELADADYLQDLQEKRRFLPGHSIVVLNRGLLPLGYNSDSHFDKIRNSDAVMDASAGKPDGGIYFMPELDRMDEITDRRLSYTDFCDDKQVEGHPPTGLFDRMRAEDWFFRAFPEFLAKIDPALLPDMPLGLPKPREFV
ncbi:hypothetical protein [Acetobacter nitrogenifigens]|uniref:Uncharacterized protein n=1 Tax=Acetobacter nitrogenifigens DSM 23921 = NBRC 105050 TaxID=1120919 RepID=A0A511XF18_9PROT|nr:hypothetical protein [Acetobacter nitrogenifigens]GEN61491.1 hypothetical protein ANI02nite_33750 [Acetobacter nitrogenifigens DSM 23921 = NBRC 105050]